MLRHTSAILDAIGRPDVREEDPGSRTRVLVNVRFLLESDGAVTVTMPPDRVAAAQIEQALVAA